MIRKGNISRISRFLQRNPAWSQVVCVVGVSLLIILGPILLYGLLFQPGSDALRIISRIPWWPVILLVVLVALLSLLHGSAGVSVQNQSRKRPVADGADETIDPPPTSSSDPPSPSSSCRSGSAGSGPDPLHCARSNGDRNSRSSMRLVR